MVLLNFRLAVIKDQLVETTDDSEYKRLQGRGKEIKDMISNLTRKPVDTQSTGAFN
jgi:hypothetical protein